MPREIQEFLERYRNAFNALDGTSVANLYAEPSGIAQDGVYTHWGAKSDVEENMKALCRLYADKGFLRASFESQQFIDQGNNHATVDVSWLIDWSQGQDSWRFRTSYNLIRTQQGWRVLLCTAYSEVALHRSTSAA